MATGLSSRLCVLTPHWRGLHNGNATDQGLSPLENQSLNVYGHTTVHDGSNARGLSTLHDPPAPVARAPRCGELSMFSCARGSCRPGVSRTPWTGIQAAVAGRFREGEPLTPFSSWSFLREGFGKISLRMQFQDELDQAWLSAGHSSSPSSRWGFRCLGAQDASQRGGPARVLGPANQVHGPCV